MDELTLKKDDSELSFWQGHRFLILVALTIIISFILVTVSLIIYNSSGAAQLDLSRPGYRSVSSQAVDNQSSFENYSASGAINTSTISEFQTLYSKQAKSATTVDAFSGDPLAPESLDYADTTTAPAEQ